MKWIWGLIRYWSDFGGGDSHKCLCFHMAHWRVVQEFSLAERKLRCDKCQRYWAMNDSVNALLPWDCDFEFLYCDVHDLGRTIQ